MGRNYILLGFIVWTTLVVNISSTFLCNRHGVDPCSCVEQIVRPVPLPKIKPKPQKICKIIGVQKYQPIGDLCECTHTLVRPALPPKPCLSCGKLPKRYFEQRDSLEDLETIRAPDYFQGGAIDGFSIYNPENQKSYYHCPADPVSVTLAEKLLREKSISVPESKLQYGPCKKPKDLPCRKEVPDIPEEKLLGVDGTIIELKPCKKYESYEDYDDCDEDEDITYERKPSCCSYRDLGYDKAKNRHVDFVVHREPHTPAICKNERHDIGCCGFKPGKLLSNRDNDKFYSNEDFFDSDDSDYDDYDHDRGTLLVNKGFLKSFNHDCGPKCGCLASKLFGKYRRGHE